MEKFRILICVRASLHEDKTGQLKAGGINAVYSLKEQNPDADVFVLSLDEPGSEDSLRDYLAYVADEAFLVHADPVETEDTVAAGVLLSEAVRRIERQQNCFDVIICPEGDPALDGLSSAIAACLDRSQVDRAVGIQPEAEICIIRQRRDDLRVLVQMPYPCVISFLPQKALLHYPDTNRLFAAARKEFIHIETNTVPPK